MGTRRNRGLLAVLAAGVVLAGCASKGPEETDTMAPVEPEVAAPVREEAAPKPVAPVTAERAKPKVDRERIVIQLPDSDMTESLPGVFYFDFDQAIVKRNAHAELDKHAMVLKEDRTFRVRLEGHADERGTREYNLALGERRANAVRAYLVAQGASRSQIEVISYGEEKPAAMGSGESVWAQNRRVEIKYRN